MVDSFDIFGGSNFIDEIIYKNELNFNIWSSNLTDMMLSIFIANIPFFDIYPKKFEKLKEHFNSSFLITFDVSIDKINFQNLYALKDDIAKPFIQNRYYMDNDFTLTEDFINLCLFVNNYNNNDLEIKPFLKILLLNYIVFCEKILNTDILLIPKRVNLKVFSPMLLNKYKNEGTSDFLLEKETIYYDQLKKILESGLTSDELNDFLTYLNDPIFKEENLFNFFNFTKFVLKGSKDFINLNKADLDPICSPNYIKKKLGVNFYEKNKNNHSLLNSYIKHDFYDHFNKNNPDSFDHIATTRVTHSVILISGFTSEGIDQLDWWSKFIKFTDYTNFYFFNWEAKTPFGLVKNLIKGIPSMLNPFTSSSYLTEKNLFVKTKFASKKFGQLLAYSIASKKIFKHQTISLVGFSLGSNVIKHCLKKLHELSKFDQSINNIISNVVFVAGATYFKDSNKWQEIFHNLINGRCINCFSKNDKILSTLFHYTVGFNATGLSPNPNLDMESFEFPFGHTEYKDNIANVREKINIEFI